MGMTVSEFRRQYHYGPYAWPGGYPRISVMSDGESPCFACLKTERRNILSAIKDNDSSGWRVDGFDINWEDTDLLCAHCGCQIESAYGQD